MRAARKGREEQRRFGSIVEAINVVEQICQDAQTGMARNAAHQRTTLEAILKVAKEHGWTGDPQLLTELGRARGELGDFTEAIGSYEAALACERGATPLFTIEQLASLTVRRAVCQASPSPLQDLDKRVASRSSASASSSS